MDIIRLPAAQRGQQAAGHRTQRAESRLLSPAPPRRRHRNRVSGRQPRQRRGLRDPPWPECRATPSSGPRTCRGLPQPRGQEGGCDSSCYRCLRDHSNAAYHPLLDWRLAVDLLSLGTGEAIDFTQSNQFGGLLVQDFCRDFGWEAVSAAGVPAAIDTEFGELAMVATHPLERQATPLPARLAAAGRDLTVQRSRAIAGERGIRQHLPARPPSRRGLVAPCQPVIGCPCLHMVGLRVHGRPCPARPTRMASSGRRPGR